MLKTCLEIITEKERGMKLFSRIHVFVILFPSHVQQVLYVLCFTGTRYQAVFVYVICATYIFGIVAAFPSGPPNTEYICQEMFPVGHQANAQFTKPPYEIQLTKNVYTQGQEKIRVTLQALHGYFIGGFFMQARVAGKCQTKEQKKSVGVFELLRGEQYLKTISCNNRLNSSVSHRINRALDHAVFNWYAPSKQIGHIYFVATVVKEKTKFWTTVYSEIVRDTNSTLQAEVCPARMLLDQADTTTAWWTTPSTPTPKERNGGCQFHLQIVYVVVLMVVAIR